MYTVRVVRKGSTILGLAVSAWCISILVPYAGVGERARGIRSGVDA